MYVHRELRVAFLAHEVTASRETARLLLSRGFNRFGGHHGRPSTWQANPVATRGYWPDIFWWGQQDPSSWSLYATVRNPFDIGHSLVCGDEMYVHAHLKLCYIAHPRTASRETSLALKRRGFVKKFGHHDVPWGPGHVHTGDRPQEGDLWWWYNEPVNEYAYYATVRSHFDLFLTLCTQMVRAGTSPNTVTTKVMAKYLWMHGAHFKNAHVLFPSFQELAGCNVLRYETLRDDLAAMFDRHHLNPLKDDEFRQEDSDTRTLHKPEGGWRGHLSDEMVRWIQERYAVELETFGYAY